MHPTRSFPVICLRPIRGAAILLALTLGATYGVFPGPLAGTSLGIFASKTPAFTSPGGRVGETSGGAMAQEMFELSDQGWEPVAPPAPDSPAGQLQAARKLLAQGKAKKAYKAADRWIKAYGDSLPISVEAYLLRGDARAAQHHYYKALYDYEFVIRRYPASEQFMTALSREFEIARLYVNGMKRHLLGMRILPAAGEGEELLIRIQERAPGSELGERASLLLADYFFDDGQMVSAAEAYDLFLVNYPDSPSRELAMLRVIHANLARYRGPAYDQRGLLEARQRIKLYATQYPAAADRIGAAALLIRIRESLAQRDLLTARWYLKRNKPISAVTLYRRVVLDYPDTAAAGDAIATLNRLGEPVTVVEIDVLPPSPPPASSPSSDPPDHG